MHYFDRVLIQMINRLIVLHLTSVLAAIVLVISLPFYVVSYVRSFGEAKEFQESEEIVTAYFVNRDEERFIRQQGYKCFLELGDRVYQFYLPDPTKEKESVRLYRAPLEGVLKTAIEVPEDPTFKNVYRNLNGDTPAEGRTLAGTESVAHGGGDLRCDPWLFPD